MNSTSYYYRDQHELKLDNDLREAMLSDNRDRKLMALFIQNQEIITLLRRQDDAVLKLTSKL